MELFFDEFTSNPSVNTEVLRVKIKQLSSRKTFADIKTKQGAVGFSKTTNN